jgi:mRNA interferase MazF
MARYIPQKGDFVALTFDPQSGHEQKGRRPALVVSNDLFNQHTGLAIVCPITNTDRNVPFHVKIPEGTSLTGFVMVDQVKSIDYVARNIRLIEPAPIQLLDEVLAILEVCLY